MLRDNIKKFRNAKNMSQEELAVHLHVVRQTISKWEKGLSVPDAEVLIHMAQVLEVPVSALLDVEIPNTETADLTKELERLNQELSEANQRAALLHRADGKRNLILFLSFLSMLVSLAAEKEIISVLLSGLCILACLFILYRNLALLTAVTSDDLKPLHTLRTATLFNGALLLVCMAMAVLTGLDILTLSENQEKIFAMLLISGIILFSGMISPGSPLPVTPDCGCPGRYGTKIPGISLTKSSALHRFPLCFSICLPHGQFRILRQSALPLYSPGSEFPDWFPFSITGKKSTDDDKSPSEVWKSLYTEIFCIKKGIFLWTH